MLVIIVLVDANRLAHHEYSHIQYTDFFSAVKIKKFLSSEFYIFNIFTQNIDCGYTLEPPSRGGSNKYTQSMF